MRTPIETVRREVIRTTMLNVDLSADSVVRWASWRMHVDRDESATLPHGGRPCIVLDWPLHGSVQRAMSRLISVYEATFRERTARSKILAKSMTRTLCTSRISHRRLFSGQSALHCRLRENFRAQRGRTSHSPTSYFRTETFTLLVNKERSLGPPSGHRNFVRSTLVVVSLFDFESSS